jgi:hypothetical protein
LEDDIYLAEPEKALLDQLYLVSKGMAVLDLEALDLKSIRKTTLRKFALKYPRATQKLVEML